ncbi:MAG: hypothetical protein M0T84_04305 [Betaproteobacteria bacterium]|nr:hypothetical protein [Betaproteobacteria bacterium]
MFQQQSTASGLYESLLLFRAGKITQREIMKRLNIDSEKALFLMMREAGLLAPSRANAPVAA